MKIHSVIACTLGALVLAGPILAGTTGKIAGRVVDKGTGQGLPFATIQVVGTSLGAVADMDGNYFIINVPPGIYSLEGKMMGYSKMTATNVKVSLDLTTTIQFVLSTQVIQLGGITVREREKMIKPDVTSSQRNVTRDVLVTLPGVDNFSQALEKNTSAVGTGRQIHIRGGRTGEVSYMVDGLSIKDPLASGSFGMMVGTNSISEMSTILGGFNAEYGQAQSGIVNMVTKEGSARFSGNVAYRTDRVPGTTREEHRFLNFDRTEVSFGGPEFFTNSLLKALRLPGSARYFAATDGEWQDGYGKYINNWQTRYRVAGITLQDRRLNNYTGSLKWTYELSGKKLTLALRGSQGHSFGANPMGAVEYVYAYKYTPEFAPRVNEYGNQEVLAWTHVISQNTFYTLNLSRFLTAYRERPGGRDVDELNDYSWDTSMDPLEIIAYTDGKNEPFIDLPSYNGVYDAGETYVDLNGNNSYDPGEPFVDKATTNGHYDPGEPFRDWNHNGFWSGTEPYTDLNKNKQYDPGEPFVDWNGNGVYDQKKADGFYDYGFDQWARWRDYRTVTYTAKVDFTSQRGKAHLLKGGVEYKRYDIRKGEIQYGYRKYDLTPDSVSWLKDEGWGWPDRGVFRDFYLRHPVAGAVYLQDKIETEGMIVNAGLRYDFFYVGRTAQTFIDPITDDTVKIAWENRLAPRIGIAHPITEKDKLFFNYGIFYEIPQFNYIFELATQGGSAYKYYGNPGLKPTRNTQYELGVDHALAADWVLGVSGFFKDYRDLVDMQQRGQPPLDGHIFSNLDYGNVRGLELNLEKFPSHYTRGSIAYTLSWAMGKSSSDRQNYDYDYGNRPLPIKDFPLSWDQRHALVVDFDYRVGKGEHPVLFGRKLPQGWGINLLWQASSGLPYTKTLKDGSTPDPQYTDNAFRLPGNSSVDLKASKDLYFGPVKAQGILQVKNLFDKLNVRNIDTYTGQSFPTDTESKNSPDNYYPRRNIQAGVGIEW